MMHTSPPWRSAMGALRCLPRYTVPIPPLPIRLRIWYAPTLFGMEGELPTLGDDPSSVDWQNLHLTAMAKICSPQKRHDLVLDMFTIALKPNYPQGITFSRSQTGIKAARRQTPC